MSHENENNPQNPEIVGQQQLAASLEQVIAAHAPEESNEAVGQYLTDILADATGEAPPLERSAAFGMLAERQKGHIDDNTLDVMIETTDRLAGLNRHTAPDLLARARKTRSAGQAISEEHTRGVVRAVHRDFDPRRIKMAHGRVVEMVQEQILRSSSAAAGDINSWRMRQKQLVAEFEPVFSQGVSHKAKLERTARALQSSDEQPETDPATLIQAEIIKQASAEIVAVSSLATANGENTTVPLVECVGKKASEQRSEQITNLGAAVLSYPGESTKGVHRVVDDIEDSTRKFRAFMSRGEDEYAFARSLPAFETAVSEQKRRLDQAMLPLDDSGKQMVSLMANAEQMLAQIAAEVNKSRKAQ